MRTGTLLLSLLALLPAAAEDFAPPVPMPDVWEVRISNGMRFLLVERHDAPIFYGHIAFKVGGVDEPAGATGLAHLFEHMAFKGTRAIGTKDWPREKALLDRIEKVGAGMTALSIQGNDPEGAARLRAELETLHAQLREVTEQSAFDGIYSRAGERGMNAYTGKDLTAYHVSLPSNRLELWMLMESERLRDPVLREFYTERDVVTEERRMRTDSNPGGLMWERMSGTAFLAHPYRTPTIGWMSDIQSLTLEEARAFYHRHYSPDNAVGVLVGDLDIPKTEVMLEKWFGRIPKRGSPPPVTTVEPPQMGERRVEVRFPQSSPRLMLGFHKRCAPHPDDTLADVTAALLGDGRTSRLYRRLVLKDRLASSVFAHNGFPGGRYDNLLVLGATPLHKAAPEEMRIRAQIGAVQTRLAGLPGKAPDQGDASTLPEAEGKKLGEELESLQAQLCKMLAQSGMDETRACEAAILDELRILASSPPTEAELSRVRAQQEVGLMTALASNSGLGGMLVSSQVVVGNWRESWNFLERLRGVAPKDIQDFSGRCFIAENRTVLTLLPKEAP